MNRPVGGDDDIVYAQIELPDSPGRPPVPTRPNRYTPKMFYSQDRQVTASKLPVYALYHCGIAIPLI